MLDHSTQSPPRWLFWWACLTVAAACPLLLLGAQVTSLGVGMADQRPVVLPHQAVQEMARGGQSFGWKFEHVHRLAGWFIGVCGIVLAAGAWLCEPRRGVRWLATLALVLIICQGLLGIFRVALNDWWGGGLAWIHGSFAQLVFAVLVSVALLLSRSWLEQETLPNARSLRGLALGCVGLVFAQLVLGGVLRHLQHSLFAQLHFLGAFAVFAALLWLVKASADDKAAFAWAPWLLLGLLLFQVMLGVHVVVNWFGRYFIPSLGIQESLAVLWMRSAHYFLGSLVFAVTVVIAWKAHRCPVGQAASLSIPQARHNVGLEGAL